MARREALRLSGTALTGLSVGLRPEQLLAQVGQASQEAPDRLVDTDLRSVADLTSLWLRGALSAALQAYLDSSAFLIPTA